MKVAAVICEYNPFHNGHRYQIEMIKRDFDAVFCVMSGSFVERGDVAIFDKWTRTKAALKGGADLILELPARYSLSSANGFARGAVKTVISCGIADALVFGSETGSIEKLSEAADILLSEPPEISQKIKMLLSEGMSFPMAKQTAFSDLIDSDILIKPNNILATEYIMALKEEKSPIVPITHSRTAEHLGGFSENGHASASYIREKIKNGENFEDFCPCDYADCEIYDINRLTDIFKYLLITRSEKLFADIPDAEDGLFNRFLKFSDLGSFEEIINASVTKRYTRSYLSRVALRAVLGINGGYRPPEYIKVLGANAVGRTLLSEMKKTATLPIVTKVADFPKTLLEEDIRATDIASLCGNAKKGRDFLISPIII